MKWRTFSGAPLQLNIKDAVEEAIIRETRAGYKLKVCIGTDSQVYSSEIEFATVIVFLREKRGGFMFIHNERVHRTYSIKERRSLMNYATSSTGMMWIWKFMRISIPIRNLKATKHCGKPWAIFSGWALPLKQNRKHLPAVAAPIRSSTNDPCLYQPNCVAASS